MVLGAVRLRLSPSASWLPTRAAQADPRFHQQAPPANFCSTTRPADESAWPRSLTPLSEPSSTGSEEPASAEHPFIGSVHCLAAPLSPFPACSHAFCHPASPWTDGSTCLWPRLGQDPSSSALREEGHLPQGSGVFHSRAERVGSNDYHPLAQLPPQDSHPGLVTPLLPRPDAQR